MRKLRGTALAIAALVPLEAQALSCMEPSIERSFQAAQASTERYVVVAGRVTLDEKLLPQGSIDPLPPRATRVPARLTGKSLTLNGFTRPYEQLITLEVGCVSVWCGGVSNGEEIVGFLRITQAGYVLRVDPCRDHVIANTAKVRRKVAQCFRGGAC